jgi:glutamate/tyrosine decarboxylase-like PLP-dependent enzyme
MEAAGPARLELVVLDWFKQWIGFPEKAAGILVSGGSAANLTALACAREALVGSMRDDVVIYASDQAHSSIARAARALGFTPSQLRVLPTDDEYRLRPDALTAAISEDKRAGRTPLVVCAAAGSTNTGAVDPLSEIADICREEQAWLHVDGAYGGFSALTERGGKWLAGIELADSVTLDPHKWLYQPFECGCVLIREGRLLESAFQIEPSYLKDARQGLQAVSFGDRGLQLSRAARSLKLWISITTFGVEAFRAAIDRCLDLAIVAEEAVRRSDELELMRPARLGITCFRRSFGGESSEPELAALNRRLVADLAQSGSGFVSSTSLRGRYAIRLCVLNHTTTEDDVLQVIDWLARHEVDERAALSTPAESEGAENARQDEIGEGWGTGQAAAKLMAELDLFEGVEADQLTVAGSEARVTSAAAGESITTRWTAGREFHVIVQGRAKVLVGEEQVRELGPGDFFGELAALDWGAGYGYARLATVTALEQMELLVFPADTLNRLHREAPAFAARIDAAVRERLPKS